MQRFEARKIRTIFHNTLYFKSTEFLRIIFKNTLRYITVHGNSL